MQTSHSWESSEETLPSSLKAEVVMIRQDLRQLSEPTGGGEVTQWTITLIWGIIVRLTTFNQDDYLLKIVYFLPNATYQLRASIYREAATYNTTGLTYSNCTVYVVFLRFYYFLFFKNFLEEEVSQHQRIWDLNSGSKLIRNPGKFYRNTLLLPLSTRSRSQR